MAKKEFSFEDIVRQIDSRQFAPIYFLMGEEPYFIDCLAEYIQNHFFENEADKEFDQCLIYGKDLTSLDPLITAARRYPMLSERQLIILKEAQMVDRFEDEFLPYVKIPTPSTVLVITYKKSLDKRKKLAAELYSNAVVFESKKLYDNQIPAWIKQFASSQGMRVEEKASQMLTEFLGTDLGRIASEIKKLKIVLPKDSNGIITPELVERNIGISKDYNTYELLDAIRLKNFLKAQTIALHFSKNDKDYPLPRILSVLYDYFSMLLIYYYLTDKNPYSAERTLGCPYGKLKMYEEGARNYPAGKVMRNISLIREYDAKGKGFGQISTPASELLRELICRLMA